jgi:hypothetical protein
MLFFCQGVDPVFPDSIIAMKTLPQKYKWLRKTNTDSSSDLWRTTWIETLKADITAQP